jgi:hypothetical protein
LPSHVPSRARPSRPVPAPLRTCSAGVSPAASSQRFPAMLVWSPRRL